MQLLAGQAALPMKHVGLYTNLLAVMGTGMLCAHMFPFRVPRVSIWYGPACTVYHTCLNDKGMGPDNATV